MLLGGLRVFYLLSIVHLQISMSDLQDSLQEVHIQGPILLLLLNDPTDKTWSQQVIERINDYVNTVQTQERSELTV